MTKKEINAEFEAMKKLNKVIFDKYDPNSLTNEYVTKRWNSGKVNYLQHYFNRMLRNDEFEGAEWILETKSIEKALDVVEYICSDVYNSSTWPDIENKVSWNEVE